MPQSSFSRPRFWLFPLAFVLVASPLLAYNWQVFGSPIFNYNTAHVIWLDYTEEQMIMFDKGLPTMFSYLATHSFADILQRFLRGLVRVRGVEWVWPFLVDLCLHTQTVARLLSDSPCKATDGHGRQLIGVNLLSRLLRGALSSSVAFAICCRYFPVIFLMLADFLVFYAARLVRRWWPAPRPEHLTRLAMRGLLVALSVVWLVQVSWRDFQAPLDIDFEDQATAEMYRLLDTPVFDGKQVLFGPSHEFTGTWLFRHHVTFPLIPPGLSASEFATWLKRAGIDYILANREMIRRRRHSVGEYLAYVPGEGVQILTVGTRMGGRLPRTATVEVCADSCALERSKPVRSPTCILPAGAGRRQVERAQSSSMREGSVINGPRCARP